MPEGENLSPWASFTARAGAGGGFFCAGAGIVLSMEGWRVNLIDLKDDHPTLHIYFDREPSPLPLSDMAGSEGGVRVFLKGTDVSSLWLLPGFRAGQDMGGAQAEEVIDFLSPLLFRGDELTLINLGNRRSSFNFDVFLRAGTRSIILSPSPYDIEGVHRFLLGLLLHLIKRERGIPLPSDFPIQDEDSLLKYLKGFDPFSEGVIGERLKGRVHLILNQVQDEGERGLGFTLAALCRKLYGIDVRFAGMIPFREEDRDCLRKRIHPLVERPLCELHRDIKNIVDNIALSRELAFGESGG